MDGAAGKKEELSGANQSTANSAQPTTTKVYGSRSRTLEATVYLQAADKAGRTPVQTRKPRTHAVRTPVRPLRVQTNMLAYLHPNKDSMPNTAYL
eukprot:gene14739-31327_t